MCTRASMIIRQATMTNSRRYLIISMWGSYAWEKSWAGRSKQSMQQDEDRNPRGKQQVLERTKMKWKTKIMSSWKQLQKREKRLLLRITLSLFGICKVSHSKCWRKNEVTLCMAWINFQKTWRKRWGSWTVAWRLSLMGCCCNSRIKTRACERTLTTWLVIWAWKNRFGMNKHWNRLRYTHN